ncbi:MAG: bi-domain-containing oxidoreductase [Anaerolineae bacterium]|nr:bi-domain-containing oxidoreductase [Anaerolineae bacterium]
MKQLLQNLRTGETTVSEVPIPTPTPGTALVRTAVSLVSSGTERMLVEFAQKSWIGKANSRPDQVRQVMDKARREGLLTTVDAVLNRLDQPMPLGYSSAGTIIAVGDGLQGLRVGDRVACAGGGYAVHAEYAVVPENLITILPKETDFESAAFATLGAIAMHGFRLANIQLGERVAVIGLGLLGLLAASIADASGCQVLGIDLNPDRIALAKNMDLLAVSRDQAEEVSRQYSNGQGYDAILICADTPSNDPINLAGAIARDRANVVAIGAVGLNIPRAVYFAKELNFINSRSYGPGRYDPNYEEKGNQYPIGYIRWTEGRNLESFVDLVARKRIDVKPLITHRFTIEDAPQAYDLILGKRETPFLGILLTYPQNHAVDSNTSKIQVSKLPKTNKISRINLGILGAGNFASAVMLPALKKNNQINMVGIVSATGLNAQFAANKFGIQFASSDIDEIIENSNINTVAVLTRHHLHSQQVLAALQANKHVFVEKPLAINQIQLEAIKKQIASNKDLLLTVGFNRRFAPLAKKMQTFVNQRVEPLMAHYRINAGQIPLTHWLHDPEVGGGRIIGEGCHFIDFLTFLVGELPVSVTAHALPDRGRYKEDNVQLTFDYPDGSLGTVSYFANGDKALAKERIEVLTGGSAAILDDFRSLTMIQAGKRKIIRSRLRQDKGFSAEWKAFANTILQGGPPPIPYEQIFSATQAAFAAVKALRSGERVTIP